MTNDTKPTQQEEPRKTKVIYRGNAVGCRLRIWLDRRMGLLPDHCNTFWMGALGILKGIVWPAMLVFELMKYLHM